MSCFHRVSVCRNNEERRTGKDVNIHAYKGISSAAIQAKEAGSFLGHSSSMVPYDKNESNTDPEHGNKPILACYTSKPGERRTWHDDGARDGRQWGRCVHICD